MSSDFFEKKRS